MALSSGHAEPTETSPLLRKDASAGIGASSIPAPNSTIQETPVKAANSVQTDGARDEEAGEGEEPVNPLFEGLPDAAARLHILVPAVAIGVSRKLYYTHRETADPFHRSSCPLRIRQSLCQRMGKLARSSTR